MNAAAGVLLTLATMNFRSIQDIRRNVSDLKQNVYVGAAQVNARIDALPPDDFQKAIDENFDQIRQDIQDQRERIAALEYMSGSMLDGRTGR